MGIIFRKTPKGSSEIESRAHRLTPRMRSTLILVDGRRSDAELRTMIVQQCDETLQALVDQGFIEPAAQTAEPRPTATAPAPNPAPTPQAAPAARPEDFMQLRRDAVRQLTDLVGPMAESLAMRMERARDMAELAPMLATAAQIIGNVRGASAANAYSAKFKSD